MRTQVLQVLFLQYQHLDGPQNNHAAARHGCFGAQVDTPTLHDIKSTHQKFTNLKLRTTWTSFEV